MERKGILIMIPPPTHKYTFQIGAEICILPLGPFVFINNSDLNASKSENLEKSPGRKLTLLCGKPS